MSFDRSQIPVSDSETFSFFMPKTDDTAINYLT